MEDEKNVNYVTKEDLYHHVSVLWMFIMFTLMATFRDDERWRIGLTCMSSVMFVVTLVYAMVLNRRKRRARG